MVSGGPRRITVLNIVKIGLFVAEILQCFEFSRWRPSTILDLFGAYLDYPQLVLVGLYHSAKFGYDRCSSFYKPPAHRCPQRRRRRQQRQRVTEWTAMAPWNGPNDVTVKSHCRRESGKLFVMLLVMQFSRSCLYECAGRWQ